MSALTIPTDATASEAARALHSWLDTLPPLAAQNAALMGATLRAGGS